MIIKSMSLKCTECDHAKFINKGNIERDDPNQEQPLKY